MTVVETALMSGALPLIAFFRAFLVPGRGAASAPAVRVIQAGFVEMPCLSAFHN